MVSLSCNLLLPPLISALSNVMCPLTVEGSCWVVPMSLGHQPRALYIMVAWGRLINEQTNERMTPGCSFLLPSLGWCSSQQLFPSWHLRPSPHSSKSQQGTQHSTPTQAHRVYPQPDAQLRNPRNSPCLATAPGQIRAEKNISPYGYHVSVSVIHLRLYLLWSRMRGTENRGGSGTVGTALLLPLPSRETWGRTPPDLGSEFGHLF